MQPPQAYAPQYPSTQENQYAYSDNLKREDNIKEASLFPDNYAEHKNG